MKKLTKYLILLCVLILNIQVYPQQSDPIKSYPGIPIITYGYDITGHDNPPGGSYLFNDMENAGIFALEVANMSDDKFYLLENTGLKIIPEQVSSDVLNYIITYTDGRYTEWEAEGTPLEDGNVTLLRNSQISNVSNGAVYTTGGSGNDTLIYGPYYRQQVNYCTYCAVEQSERIDYTADFKMKLALLDQQSPSLTDTICRLQVAANMIDTSSTGWKIYETIVVKDTFLTYNDFLPLNNWDNFLLEYDLTELPDSFYNYSGGSPVIDPYLYSYLDSYSALYDSTIRNIVKNIEFKVIWKGNPQVTRLYVDKITVADDRGWDLMNISTPTTQITQQIQESTNYSNRISGWLAIDEPASIDQYGPIKKVSEVVEDNSNTQLWVSLPASWSGRFGNPGNPFGEAPVYKGEEFIKRVKKANLWVNYYLYDWPYKNEHRTDYKEENIKLLKQNFVALQEYSDLFWGASVQTGKYRIYEPGGINYREITGSEFLYQSNLVLMLGAKIISPWLYFGSLTIANGDTLRHYTGFVNRWENYLHTDKYNTLKDILAPRLNGEFGKTLKQLTPTIDTLRINPSVNYDINLNYIKRIKLDYESQSALNSFVDLGFFNKPQASEDDYFMIINRYYSDSLLNKFIIEFKDLNNFNNWNLMNYVDSSYYTIVPDQNGFAESNTDTILVGDAILYSIIV